MTILVVLVLVVAALGLALRIKLGQPSEDKLRPDEVVDSIAALRSPLPQNSYLACPPNYCAAREAATSPVFAMPWERLRDFWLEVIADDRRLVAIDGDAERRHLVYIQHTPILRFPDIVTVEFAALAPDRSSIALYSRSRYGKSDFGKNRKRVQRWLLQLERAAGPAASGR